MNPHHHYYNPKKKKKMSQCRILHFPPEALFPLIIRRNPLVELPSVPLPLDSLQHRTNPHPPPLHVPSEELIPRKTNASNPLHSSQPLPRLPPRTNETEPSVTTLPPPTTAPLPIIIIIMIMIQPKRNTFP